MKFLDLQHYFLKEQEENLPQEEQNSYDMTYVNGGFSNSVDVQPGTGEDIGKVKVSINIFGGGQKKKVVIPTPPKIAQMLKAYEVAVRKQDPSADKFKQQLEAYYETLRNTIASKFVPLIQELDNKAKQVIIQSVKESNEKFQ